MLQSVSVQVVCKLFTHYSDILFNLECYSITSGIQQSLNLALTDFFYFLRVLLSAAFACQTATLGSGNVSSGHFHFNTISLCSFDFEHPVRFLWTGSRFEHGCVFPLPGCEGIGCESAKASGKRDQHSELLNQFNEMNAQSAAGQHRGSGAVLPFIGLTGSKW